MSALLKRVREELARVLREQSKHVDDNSKALSTFAWEKEEARARELAGLYLSELAALIEQELLPIPLPALSAEIAALERDAERYRHMHDNAKFQDRNGPGVYWYLPRWDRSLPVGERLDKAIDAAIAAAGGKDEPQT